MVIRQKKTIPKSTIERLARLIGDELPFVQRLRKRYKDGSLLQRLDNEKERSTSRRYRVAGQQLHLPQGRQPDVLMHAKTRP